MCILRTLFEKLFIKEAGNSMIQEVYLSNYPLAKIFKIAKSEIDRVDFALCSQPKETLDAYYKRQTVKPDLMSNGGFFALATGETVFKFVDNGQLISDSTTLLDGIGTKNGQLVFGKYDSSFTDFVSAYPVLIKDGKPFTSSVGSELDCNARRTVLAYDPSFVYMIAVESPGYNFSKLKSLLQELKVTYAVNLDGGGSTRILKEGVCQTSKLLYNRPIDNVVCIYLKKEQPLQIVYRVQTGAFSKKENAEKYQATIRALDDKISAGYKNAYVRLINGLYKVQVGAFSKKENAVKVVNDLESMGINSFITTA